MGSYSSDKGICMLPFLAFIFLDCDLTIGGRLTGEKLFCRVLLRLHWLIVNAMDKRFPKPGCPAFLIRSVYAVYGQS